MRKLLMVLQLALALMGVVWLITSFTAYAGVEPLLIWDVIAVAYLVCGWLLIRSDPLAHKSFEILGPRWYTHAFAVIVSCLGLAGGLLMVIGRDELHEGAAIVQLIAAVTIILSWILLHAAFAQIYAREYQAEGGLEFPQCADPGFGEYVYLSITLGTSFSVSDTVVTSTSMRRRIVVHSIISFFFNAVLIALVIDWIKR